MVPNTSNNSNGATYVTIEIINNPRLNSVLKIRNRLGGPYSVVISLRDNKKKGYNILPNARSIY